MNIRNPLISSVLIVSLFWFAMGMIAWYFIGSNTLGVALTRAWDVVQILVPVVVLAVFLPFARVAWLRRREQRQLGAKQHILQYSTIGRVPLHRTVSTPQAGDLARSAARLSQALEVPVEKDDVAAAVFNTLEHQKGKIFKFENKDLTLDQAAIQIGRRIMEQATHDLSPKILTILSVASLLCLVDKPKGTYTNQDVNGRDSACVLSRYPLFHNLPFDVQRICNLGLNFISKCDNIPGHAPQFTSDYVVVMEHGLAI
jgi:hypothetical protein